MNAVSWTRIACALLLSLGCGQDPPPAPPAPEPPPGPTLMELPELPNPIPCPAEARAIPRDLELSESGRIASRVLVEGEGEAVGPYDGVSVHLTGWRSADGHNFVDTRAGIDPRPQLLRMNEAFPGLREGLLSMVEGETRRMWLPQDPIGEGLPGNRPEGLIVLAVEVVGLNEVPDPPDPLAEPPADAIHTDSGLAYVVLEPGEEGGEHPSPDAPVRLHYAGWRAEDGECFATSYWRDRYWVSAPNRMIAGLREGVPLMRRGGHAVFWVPAELAYEGRDGPQGMLVFDVRLLDF